MLTIILLIIIVILVLYGIYRRNSENRAIYDSISVWSDFIIYIRALFTEIINKKSTTSIQQRLEKSISDIGIVYSHNYNDESAQKLVSLLKNNYVPSIIELSESVSSNNDDTTQIHEKLKDNATEISTILNNDEFINITQILVNNILSYKENDMDANIKYNDEFTHSVLQLAFVL